MVKIERLIKKLPLHLKIKMRKEEIINSKMMHILTGLLYEEYLDMHETRDELLSVIDFKKLKKLHPRVEDLFNYVEKRFLRMDINKEKGDILRGYIIAPELLHHEKFTSDETPFEDIETIMNREGSIYNFFRTYHKDCATIVGEHGISPGHYLKTVEIAEKILGLGIENIISMYIPNVIDPGARLKSSVAAAALLNNQHLLDKNGIKINYKDSLKDLASYKRRLKFYDGNIYCKRQTITSLTFTAPINVFSKSEIASAEFSLQRVEECHLITDERYITKKNKIKKEYLFSNGVVGVLKISKCDLDKGYAVMSREFLIKPSELDIQPRYTP